MHTRDRKHVDGSGGEHLLLELPSGLLALSEDQCGRHGSLVEDHIPLNRKVGLGRPSRQPSIEPPGRAISNPMDQGRGVGFELSGDPQFGVATS